jgi:hypothetical protein
VQLQLCFHIDPETRESHLHQHGVTEEEVEEVMAKPGDDFPAREGSRIALGQTEAGRTGKPASISSIFLVLTFARARRRKR